ncbi:MAG: phosphoribosylformylglycinamidine synthase [Bacteroidetes bacterium]|uniref:Phosphoribosylformylglycinamidine synthase n=1 Tax=Phaeocystidibacter marisrubri TaxID=1577780 RepID=A0A6L3ZGH4_9FLAO|nr:HAEPLYID family protein [Phaeocystidibacter marisrubri]KAB2817011.1 phosphoribosylformylglycinamidine synthase [Phaeocystidibacter marisrubri]TNE31456.1 MAG: phosphoribosylformylglycinamidine synthase [Bacteroidota bacterium]GGH77215.1 hypothetical protein GCM10011318_26650 [Phaeocystidibacter marisrubri]
MKNQIAATLLLLSSTYALAQVDPARADSLYILEVEDGQSPDKVLHAEPLYIDLIRDLGARKGEREWNLGFGLADNTSHDKYEALVEYEWAPIDRLGLEVEIPFSFHSPLSESSIDSIPGNKMESLKVATQWSFYVNERISTSMALGYIHEFELSDFRSYSEQFYTGNLYNPFLVIAKRWGTSFHTMIYTGPRFSQHFGQSDLHFSYEFHPSFHYMIPGTSNFLGLESNMYFADENHITLRPQMRLEIAHGFKVGIIAGIPVNRKEERFSTFLRLIWEP